MIRRGVERGWLIPRLPRVYALGHVAESRAATLWEAVLYAGPGAMLSHMTAAQWRGYIRYAPQATHVSTPRNVRGLAEVAVHARRALERSMHEEVPVTTIAQTFLDLAAQRPDLLPRALGQADYQQQLDLAALDGACHKGVRGATDLHHAIATYDPAYARLNDVFEVDFYGLCQEWGITPLPLINVEVAPKLILDALWPDHHLGVELDGRDNHSSNAQLLRDAERDLICRGLGLTIIRYRRGQILRTPHRVRADLQAQLQLRTASDQAA